MTNRFFSNTVLALILPVLFLSCRPSAPVIMSIDPKIGRMGELVTLTGSNFGALREESYVTIAGIAPTNSAYHLWQDNMIVIRIPELGESGLVYVHIRGRRSNGVLFSNSATVPRPVEGEELGLQPRITSVNPQTGAPGALITITGTNFGVSRENSLQTMSTQGIPSQAAFGVFFSWDFDSGPFNPFVVREPEFIEVSEIELGYESWSARELRVRVPDGAISGNVEVRTPHGRSRPVFFDVSGRPGTKNFKDKRSYLISYSVDIRVLEATRPNTLYLWVPRPITSPSQRNVTLISRNIEPFIENHRGVSLFKLDNIGTGSNHSINLSFHLEVYAVETGIRPFSIRQESSALSAMHTQSLELLPSDDQRIRTTVNSILGREQNPYIRARALYDWILRNIQIEESLPSPISIFSALEERKADPYTVTLLYVTMARAAGIPCIPLAGVLIDRSGQTSRHYWAEFWIDGFGWLPVDPAMGAGAISAMETSGGLTVQGVGTGDIVTEQDMADFYFGNIDNMRIAFSRGDIVLSQMESRGRPVSHTRSYSLQNIWEEAVGGLESYSSLWGDIIITGIYVQ
jgi:transglutaminase-like putative cysteine protease